MVTDVIMGSVEQPLWNLVVTVRLLRLAECLFFTRLMKDVRRGSSSADWISFSINSAIDHRSAFKSCFNFLIIHRDNISPRFRSRRLKHEPDRYFMNISAIPNNFKTY